MFNKKMKMFLLFTFICITIIGLSTISASEINDNTIDDSTIVKDTTTSNMGVTTINTQKTSKIETNNASTKNKEISKKYDKNIKSEGEGTFAELETDINSSEVTLTKDYIQGELESNITITEDKIIDGAGHTLTVHNGTFIISSGITFTLKNIKIQTLQYASNMPNPQPYYYDIANRGNVILENVTFQYLSSERTYGAPVNMYANSNITIKDSVFDGYDTNQAIIYGYASGININVENSLFTNFNTANAAIYMRYGNSNLTLKNSNFTNAGAETGNGINSGGALYLYNVNQNALIENCLFENITSNNRGAAMYTSGNTTVKNSVFKNLKQNSSSTYNGGAIWVNVANSCLCLENNTMENIISNSANIYFNNGKINSTVKVTGESVSVNQEDSVDVVFNITDDNGNSIDIKSAFTMELNNVEYPLTVANGSATITVEASMDPGVYPITLDYNTNNILGEVTLPEINLTVIDIGLIKYSNITNLINNAEEGSTVNINSIVVRGSTEDSIVIDKKVNLDFNGNTLNAKNGKVFDITENATVTIKNAIITNVGNPSSSVYNTEGRIANVTGGKLTFENVTFENNRAPDFGSSAKGSFILAYDTESSVKLQDCTVTNSTGVFINNVLANVEINNTKFLNNKDSQQVGIITNGGLLSIYNSVFEGNTVNTAIIHGQCNVLSFVAYDSSMARTFYNGPLVISNTSFIDNYAGSGRGAAVNTQNDTNITDSVFIFNRVQSSNEGGAIRSEDGDLLIDRCIFINNSARISTSYSGVVTPNNGTAIFNSNGGLNIKNSIIISNVTGASAVLNEANGTTLTANNNYWGTNDIEGRYASKSGKDEITVDNWVILNLEVTPVNAAFKENVTIKASLKSTDGQSITDLTESLPEYGTVTFTAEGGELADSELSMINGEAVTTMLVKLSPFTIKATYPNAEAEYIADATMPQPQVYVLNNGNWTYYFNDDGTVNEDVVIPYSELQFVGEFKDKDMIITIPLNITTSPEEQAVLDSCTITVKATGVNITDIQMKAYDTKTYLICLDDVKNTVIENNTLHIENTDQTGLKAHAIEINSGSNNIIRNNNITTDGPEKNLIYSNDYNDADVITASINAVNTKALIIDSNKIYTKSNGESDDYGTIYGIYLCGRYDDEITILNSEVTNNYIVTQAQKYAYGLYVGSHANNVTITENEFVSQNSSYVNGIYTFLADYLNINNNRFNLTNDGISYAIVVTGKNDYNEIKTIYSGNHTISDNVILMNSTHANALQLLYMGDSEIYGNNITIDSDYGAGLVSTLFVRNNVHDNVMIINSAMQTEGPSYDLYFENTVGISLVDDMMGSSDNNNISNNTIVLTCGKENISAINLESGIRNTAIRDNYLVSTYGYGDKAVANQGTRTTISNNTPVPSTIIITVTPETLKTSQNKTVDVAINLTGQDDKQITKGTVRVYIENEKIAELDVATDELVVPMTREDVGVYNVTVNYVTYNDGFYKNTELKTNITITRASIIDPESIENLTLNENTTLQATFCDENGDPVTSGVAIFKVNGKILRDDEGKVIYVDVVDGEAVLDNVTVTGEWMKPDTKIQAVCIGDDIESSIVVESTVNVTKPTASITITAPVNATAGEEIILSADVADGESKVNSGRVVFKLNGKTLKDGNGKALYVDVVDGVATTTYTIPAKTKAKDYVLTAVFTDKVYDRCESETNLTVVKA